MNFRKLALLIFTLLVIVLGYLYQRPVPPVRATLKPVVLPAVQTVTLPWPSYGSGALAAQDYGILQTNGTQTAVPMASINKVITALAVLKQKPLAAGEQGPAITISDQDVAIYNNYYSQGGSVVKVETGEQLTQYQALQAMLLPSGNNIADTLAIWAFGSLDKYVAFVNPYIKQLGADQTTVADASGFSPKSLSTATDLTMLGLLAMKNSVIAEVVKQDSADIPVAGTVHNTNWLLGEDGVVGIKTGNTDEAGGCYLFASNRQVSGQKVLLVGTLMQAPTLNAAITDGRQIIKAADQGFELVTAVNKNQVVATYQAPWGSQADAQTDNDLSLLRWRGSPLEINDSLRAIGPTSTGTDIGQLELSNGQTKVSSTVSLKSALAEPSWQWRIFH